MRKALNRMFSASRFPFSLPKMGRLLLRVAAAALGVALLLAGGTVFGVTHPAKAAGGANCSATGPIGPFVHRATSANTFGSYTILDDTQAVPVAGCSGQYLAFVTPDWNPGGTHTGFDNHPVGVWYDDSLQPMVGQWAIANEDGAAMPVGAAFNVYFAPLGPLSIQNNSAGVGYEEASTAPNAEATIIDNYILALNLPSLWGVSLNGNPSAQLIVTQSYFFGNSNGKTKISNPHQIGVWYDSALGEWTIYNEDKSPIPVGATFNLMVVQPTVAFSHAFTQTATSSNTAADETCINSLFTNNTPSEAILVTHVYSGYFTDVPAVYYNSTLQQWCVFDGSIKAMLVGAQFSILAF